MALAYLPQKVSELYVIPRWRRAVCELLFSSLYRLSQMLCEGTEVLVEEVAGASEAAHLPCKRGPASTWLELHRCVRQRTTTMEAFTVACKGLAHRLRRAHCRAYHFVA